MKIFTQEELQPSQRTLNFIREFAHTFRVIDMNGQSGKVYYAMTNIGLRPSVEEKKGVNLESYLFGNPGNLYGETCTVSLYHFHRPEQKFESIDRLVEQLKQDRAYCAEYFSIRE